jgi:hypothetical protein
VRERNSAAVECSASCSGDALNNGAETVPSDVRWFEALALLSKPSDQVFRTLPQRRPSQTAQEPVFRSGGDPCSFSSALRALHTHLTFAAARQTKAQSHSPPA